MTLKGSPQQGSSSSTVGGVTLEDLQRIPTHFFTEGVVESVTGQLAVSERAAGANMTVDVAIGLCLIEITTTLLNNDQTVKTWFYNSAIASVSVPTADGTNERIDRIIAKFDTATDPDGSLGNNVSIELVQGTPSGTPAAPATPSNSISLATISVPASDTSIEDAQITDDRSFVDLISTSIFPSIAREADLTLAENDAPTWLGVITGTDTLTGTATPTRTAYSAGMRFAFRLANDNTGAVTLNVDSIGAKALKQPDGSALASDDIKAGGLIECRYDSGLDVFVMTSPKHSEPVATVTTLYQTLVDSAGITSASYVTASQSYNILADSLVAGDKIEVEIIFDWDSASNGFFKLRIGGTDVLVETEESDASGGRFYLVMHVRSIGASGKYVGYAQNLHRDTTSGQVVTTAENEVTINTTADLTVDVQGKRAAGGGSGRLTSFRITKYAAP